MTLDDLPYREIVCADFEYGNAPGEHPEPRCLVAHELRSGRRLRLWEDELLATPPFSVGEDTLYVAYAAQAEQSCHLVLGWPLPVRVLDLFAEFRNQTSGLLTVGGNGLLGAMLHYGLPCLDACEKDELRSLALRGGPYSSAEKQALLTYCESDVLSLVKLLLAMLERGHIDLPRALIRGRSTSAVARMEHIGTPIDVPMFNQIRANWDNIRGRLIDAVDADYHIYEGTTFKKAAFERYLQTKGIAWPRLPSGALCEDEQTFRDMAKAHACIAPLHELRSTLSDMRQIRLAVGRDGRNRTQLWPFSTKTSRNAPRASEFIFSPSTWVRSLIKPPPGRALAYLDYSGQEFAIAAMLSGDPQMQEAYASGDPYIYTAKLAKAVPQDATKQTHPTEREIYKVVALAVGYGQGEFSLAARLCIPVSKAREFLLTHREIFPRYWWWSDRVEAQAMLTGSIRTCFGWHLHVSGIDANPRSIRNFMLQSHGAEMMRLATSAMTEAGVQVCAPIHDGFLVEADESEIDRRVVTCRDHMEQASRIVLDGFAVRVDAKVIRYPDRYVDPRGVRMWEVVQQLLSELSPMAPVIPLAKAEGITGATLPLAPVIPPHILLRVLSSKDIDGVPTTQQHDPAATGESVSKVSQGTDPHPLVAASLEVAGEGFRSRDIPLVEGGLYQEERNPVLSEHHAGVGCESQCSTSGNPQSGIGWAGDDQSEAWAWLECDDSGHELTPATTPAVLELADDNTRFDFNERAAIHEFDGGMGRDDAERLALVEVTA